VGARRDPARPSRSWLTTHPCDRAPTGELRRGGLDRICDALTALAAHDDVQIVDPGHLYPNLRSTALKRLGRVDGVTLAKGVYYCEMIHFMRRASITITDSCGLQEEASAFAKPVLVTRGVTGRSKAVAMCVVRLVGTDPQAIRREAELLLEDLRVYKERAQPALPCGDGMAAQRIADILME